MEERGKMNRRHIKTFFSGTLAATFLFHSFGSSGFVTFADNDQADDFSQIIQEDNSIGDTNESDSASDPSDSGEDGTSVTDSDSLGSGDSVEGEAGYNADGSFSSDAELDQEGAFAEQNSDDLDSDGSNSGTIDGDGTELEDAEADDLGEDSLDEDAKDEEIAEDDLSAFTISYLANNGGALITDEGNIKFLEEAIKLDDEVVTIVGAKAIPDEGYVFANWTYDEQIISEDEAFVPTIEFIRSISEENKKVAFYANFTLESEDELTYNDPFDYEITIDGITITAHADAGIIPDGSVLNVARADSSTEDKVKEAAKEIKDEIYTKENKKSSDNSKCGVLIKSDDQIEDSYDLDGTYTFDITITNEKVEGTIQPKNEEAVTITFTNVIDIASEDTYLSVYYVETSDAKDEIAQVEPEDDALSGEEGDREYSNASQSVDEKAASNEMAVENLTKVSETVNNTKDIEFDAYHFSTYTITSTRETRPDYKHAQYTPKAFKILTGKTLEAGQFSFSIIRTDEHGTPYDESSDLFFKESGVKNDSNGLITFSTLEFDTPDTYYFKITEDIPADADKDPHMTYDENFYILRLYVSEYIDDRDKLVANPAYVKNDTLPPVSVSLYDYYGPDINVDHAFKFSNGTTYYEGTNQKTAASGSINKYTGDSAADKKFTGIVKPELVNGYPVLNSEVTGSDESLNYLFTDVSSGVVDKRENVILYDIGDDESYVYINHAFFPFDGNGEKESGDSHNYHFSVVTEAAFVIPENGKVYTEDNPNSTVDMVYEFEGDDDVWVFIDGKLVIDLGGVHDKVGATLNFNTGDIQYYQFSNKNSGSKVLKESTNLSEVYGSVWKDGKVHTLKIFYFERGKSLSEFDSNFNLALIAEFNNIYEEEIDCETSVKFSGTKTLTGRALAAGEFSFELKDADGNVIETVTNGADGSFSFSEIKYLYNEQTDDTGEHKYSISEVAGSLAYVTYDTRVYNITVTVSYDINGKALIATIQGLNADGSGANFTNSYTPPSTPPPPPPVPPVIPPSPPYTTPAITPVDTPMVLGATREVETPEDTPQVLGERRRATGDDNRIFERVLVIVICTLVITGIILMERKKKEN